MTISFSNFDSFEKPKNSAGESPDAEFKAGDFAAFLNVSALVPPITAPVNLASPEDLREITAAVQSLETNQNAFPKENQIQPLLWQNNADLPTQDLISPNREILSEAKFTPSNLTAAPQPKQSLKQEVSVSGQVKKAADFLISDNRQGIADDRFPTTSQVELAPSLETDVSESKVAAKTSTENQPKMPFAEKVGGQKSAVEKDFGQQKVADEILPAIYRRDFAPPLSERISWVQTPIVKTESNQISIEPSREKFLSNAPKAFTKVSEVLKADASVQANSALDFVAEQKFSEFLNPGNLAENGQDFPTSISPKKATTNQIQPSDNQDYKLTDAPTLATGEKIVAPIRQTAFGESGQSLNQPETKSPKAEMQFEIQANPGGQIFNNLLNSVANEPEVAETALPFSDASGKVFEQVEPRIFEVAATMQSGEEKRFLKMKLNPAELGAVEITLEKNAAGEINAHFQTESETTRQVLSESLAQLRSSLENSGWQVGNLEISCDSSSSNGGERRENKSQQFGTAAENQFVGTASFDGNSNTNDDLQSRLVNLRA